MDKQMFEEKMIQLKNEYEENRMKLIEEYLKSNRPYNIGDIFTDQIGSIIVEKIIPIYTTSRSIVIAYEGTECTKAGKIKKGNKKRSGYLSNEIK